MPFIIAIMISENIAASAILVNCDSVRTPGFFAPFSVQNQGNVNLWNVRTAKIFGDRNPVGQVTHIEPFGEVVITGVAKTIPKNSNMQFEAVVSYATLLSHFGPSLFLGDGRPVREGFAGSYRSGDA